MGEKVGFRGASRLPWLVEAGAFDAAPGRRAAALLAVLGLALVLMTIPAVVAGLAIGGSNLFHGVGSWVQDAAGWLAYLGHARAFLYLPLAAAALRVKEDA